MKKFFSVGFATLASLILIFIIVFTVLQVVINNDTFINNEFTALSVNKSMGMSNSDLVRSMQRLVDYMEGNVPDISLTVTVDGVEKEMFELDQEVEHMKDVRQIYLKIKELRDVGLLAMLVLFLLAAVVNFRKAPQTISHGYLSGCFIALLFFGFLGTWAAMDFSSFWTFFHETLFWNDLWLFDATESRMINMLPEQMFADIVGKIFLYAGIAIGILLALSVSTIVVSSPSYQKKKAERLAAKRAREAAKQAKLEAKAQAEAEKEKAKRLAAKKKRKAALAKKRAAAETAAEKAAHKAAHKAGKAAEPVRAEATADDMDEPYDDDLPDEDADAPEEADVEKAPAMRRQTARGAKREKAARPQKKKSAVSDDTGFFDDDD